MRIVKPQKLITVTIVYWVLLLYMIAALVWWFIALEKQNNIITQIKLNELLKDDPSYYNKVVEVEKLSNRKTTQYIGEGLTFLVLILIGAIFVYRATRRQLKISKQQQNFMMAITHELKTPIATAQLNLQTLQLRKLDESKQQKLISNTLQEANRLNNLCNNILFAAQLDAGKYSASLQTINLNKLVEKGLNDCKNRFPERIVLSEMKNNVNIEGDEFLLQMLLNNLIENAIKYSPIEEPINVVVSKNSKDTTLSVIDSGVGILDSEKNNIFKKFYRIGNENTRKAQGTGLGLYLCKKICEAHKATIVVTDHQPKGSIFTIKFNR